MCTITVGKKDYYFYLSPDDVIAMKHVGLLDYILRAAHSLEDSNITDVDIYLAYCIVILRSYCVKRNGKFTRSYKDVLDFYKSRVSKKIIEYLDFHEEDAITFSNAILQEENKCIVIRG